MSDGLTMMERMERTGSFLPKGVAYAIDSGRGLEFVTYAQLLSKRKRQQADHLKTVLSTKEGRRAGYVWTFYQPGLFGFAYQGWWAYLRVLGHDDLKLAPDRYNSSLLEQAMHMFPCGVIPCKENFDFWKVEFGKQYARPGRFKKQGIAPIWVDFEEQKIWEKQ